MGRKEGFAATTTRRVRRRSSSVVSAAETRAPGVVGYNRFILSENALALQTGRQIYRDACRERRLTQIP